MRKGLEPSTPGVTGRYSNQLNYRTKLVSCNRFFGLRMQRYAFFLILQIFFRIFAIFSAKNGDFGIPGHIFARILGLNMLRNACFIGKAEENIIGKDSGKYVISQEKYGHGQHRL